MIKNIILIAAAIALLYLAFFALNGLIELVGPRRFLVQRKLAVGVALMAMTGLFGMACHNAKTDDEPNASATDTDSATQTDTDSSTEDIINCYDTDSGPIDSGSQSVTDSDNLGTDDDPSTYETDIACYDSVGPSDENASTDTASTPSEPGSDAGNDSVQE